MATLQIEPSVCHVCHQTMVEGVDCVMIQACSHAFHRNCIESSLSSNSRCPECQRSCQLSELRKLTIVSRLSTVKPTTRNKPRGAMAKHYNTRSSQRNIFPESNIQEENMVVNIQDGASALPETNTNLVGDNLLDSSISNPIPTTPSPPVNTIDYNEINRLIQENLNRMLRNLNLVQPQDNHSPQNSNVHNNNDDSHNQRNFHGIPRQQAQSNVNNHYSYSPIASSNVGSTSFHVNKITSTIQNWNLKFDGSSSGLHVEEFLYRTRSLTQENFNGDFDVICRNLHILLTGKAREWYWRYHKQVKSIKWEDFCDAIRCQYKDFKSSFDIREEVRNRKQKAGETFDSFFDGVLAILDRLPSPMSDMELIEILARNLRPEIRQDLLYVPIHSISHLRKLVQMRENFLNEESVRKNSNLRNQNTMPRRYISEIDSASENMVENEEFDPSVDAVQSCEFARKCWNCDELGHHWQNCLKDRTVFCYGCGLKNIYKPNCKSWQIKNRDSKNFRPSGPLKDKI